MKSHSNWFLPASVLALLFTLPAASYGAKPKNGSGPDPATVISEFVPAKDPAPSKKISVVKDMEGVHPRLVLSDEGFAARFLSGQKFPVTVMPKPH